MNTIQNSGLDPVSVGIMTTNPMKNTGINEPPIGDKTFPHSYTASLGLFAEKRRGTN